MRTLESKIDAIQSRSDRLMQTIQAAGPRETFDVSELHAELHVLRGQLEEQRHQHTSLLETVREIDSRSRDVDAANESIASRLESHALRLTQTQERQTDLTSRVDQLQSTLQNTIESINAIRTETAAQETHRLREVAGRMVGLYIIGCIALTVAIAALIIVMTGIGTRQ
jgi:predicted nuclease with TOPRIM domain